VTDPERMGRIAAVGFELSGRDVEEVGACNLCGSEDAFVLTTRDRYGLPSELRMCRNCGLGYLSPRLTAAEYASFYASVYRPLVSAFHGRTIDAETVQDDQRSYAAELVDFLRGTLERPPGTVLDVGGSTGVVAAAVNEAFGSAATVLDPAPDELAVAASHGMEVIEGFAEDFAPGERRWDLVLLCQTIDHLLDVTATLTALRGMVAEDGHVFVDILDLMIAARKAGSVQGAAKVDHPFYLTRETALAFFEKTGLRPAAERLSGDGHWGFVLVPDVPREPDWASLGEAARRSLDELRSLG
jgi:2-polyprenyl-3-methyl-5-hydroxy-6-metoxy-1,4-benzoquinol methylase